MPSSIDVTDDPADFDEAVRAFRRRVPMPDWKWDALTEAEKEFAFKVSGAAQADLATQAWEAMDRAIKDGTTLDDFKKQVGGQLEAAWGKADPARLETIFRTNALGAYNAGRHEILNHPEVKKARPYWRFDGIDDDRQTEICEALDGTIRPADDPFWNTHTPPLHFNCRSVLVPLSQEEAEEEGIDEKSPEVDADDGFGKQPSGDEPGAGWEPDPKDYPGPIADVLEEKLQVVEAEPEPPAPPPPPPDYGPSFPRLPLEAAPELPRAPQPKWQTPPKTEDFFTQNDEPIVMGSRNLDNLVNAPGSFGTHTVLVSDKLTPGAVADYWLGRIRLSPTSAKELQVAIQRGEIRTQHELEAAGTLVHEHFHGSSNPHYDYEVSGSQANHDRVAGTVMEESTTELLAQHYREAYSRNVLHLKVTHGEREPLFVPGKGDGPELGRPVAYRKWVRGFARAAAFADDALLDMQPAEFQSHVAGRAMQIKAQPGRTERHLGKVSERYGVFMTQIFDRYGVTAEVAQSVSMQLHDLLADFIQGRPGWEQQRIADLKTAVEGIIDMGKASAK